MELLITLDNDSDLGLQDQIRQKMVEAVLSGALPAGQKILSSRKLAKELGVARNTVVLAYNQLIDEGFLVSKQRSGLYVNEKILADRIAFNSEDELPSEIAPRWQHKLKHLGRGHLEFTMPGNWQSHPYPFIDGYFDVGLYPVSQWQEASRLAFGGLHAHQIQAENDADDAMLIEQLRTKILPRRGITARREEILITSGSHHSLYLLAQLLCDETSRVAMEDPGSPTLRNCLQLTGCQIEPQKIDEEGMRPTKLLNKTDLIFITPSHQLPTGVTMPISRRKQMIKLAQQTDQLIIEDDSESERNYLGNPTPALRSLDQDNRVIYVSALPKAVAPGLGLGFIVASSDIVAETRRLRRIMVGNPPKSNQRIAAFFISLGHYDAFMMRLNSIFSKRWNALRDALNHYRPESILTIPNQGGTAFWVRCPKEVAVHDLVEKAAQQGILIEPVDDYYDSEAGHMTSDVDSCFRMGVTSLEETKIREGVEKLAKIMRELSGNNPITLDQSTVAPLNSEQLFEKLAGATIIYKTVYGAPCTIELKADGTMSGVAGHADEEIDTGRWWIKDNLWFSQWQDWAYAEQAGFYVTIDHSKISWFNEKGRLVDTGIIRLVEGSDIKLV